MKNKKIRSFDVFDTILVRSCGGAYQLFYLLSIAILGKNVETSKIYDFIKIRIEGEKEAYLYSKSEEITISDIYNYCDFSNFTDLDKKEILEKELEIEKINLIPVNSIINLINNYRSKEYQIIFISDTYLDYEFIYNILNKYKIIKPNDKLYVSSKEKLTKSSGNIYNYIAQKNNYNFKNWIHYGDNKISDLKVPKIYGIKPKLVNHDFSYYEKIGLNSGFRIEYIKNSIFMSLSKSIRLSMLENNRILFATDLIGPILVPYVYYILSETRKKNFKKIYFIARDGQILYEIAKIFKKLIFKEIELSILFLSRSSLYVAEYNNMDSLLLEKLLKDILINSRSQSKLYNCLQDFFSNEVCSKIINIIPSLKYINSSTEAIKSILNSKEASDTLINYCRKQRTNLLKYLIQKGMTSNKINEKYAIVDIRGTRKSEKIINEILKTNNFNSLYGFYLEVFYNRFLYEKDNEYNSIVFEEFKQNSYFSKFTDLSSLIENYICASNLKHTLNHIEINNKIRPNFNTFPNKRSRDLYNLNLKVLKKYTIKYIENNLFLFNEYNLKVGLDILANFSLSPNPRFLEGVDKIEGSDSHIETKYIVSKNWKDKTTWDRGSYYLRFYNLIKKLIKIRNKLYFILKIN